jgi:F-type H+-transporting ATPase subunit beta
LTTEKFSGIPGKAVSLKDGLDGCQRILNDEFASYPESAFYMIGAIDEANAKMEKSKHPGAPKTQAQGKPVPSKA